MDKPDGTHGDHHGPATPSAPVLDNAAPSLAVAYEEGHAAVSAMVSALRPDRLSTVVPACPAWSVRDLVGHLAGVAADTVDGRFPALDPHGTWTERQAVVDAFTAGQVAHRRAASTEEVLAEWASYLPRVLCLLRGDRPMPRGTRPAHAWVIVSDIAAHDQDLRGALNLPGDRDSAGVELGLTRYVAGLGRRLDAAGLPALRLITENREHVAGGGTPSASVTAGTWELFRSLGSRRSLSQLRGLAWSGDPERYLAVLTAYGPRGDDLVE